MVKLSNGMYMDGFLKSNLDIIKKIVTQDWDCVGIIDGIEGVGKSVMGMQVGWYLDNTLTVNRVCFSAKEFKDRVNDSKPYQCIIYDESFGGMSSKRSMSKVNWALQKMMTEIRKKNLFIIIIIPCFFELQKYHAIWRSRFLIHVYDHNFERGRFTFFNAERKKSLYLNGKKFYSYYKPKANFYGAFTDYYPINKAEYKKKKYADNKEDEEDTVHRWEQQRNSGVLGLLEKGWKQKEVAQLFSEKSEFSLGISAVNMIRRRNS